MGYASKSCVFLFGGMRRTDCLYTDCRKIAGAPTMKPVVSTSPPQRSSNKLGIQQVGRIDFFSQSEKSDLESSSLFLMCLKLSMFTSRI